MIEQTAPRVLWITNNAPPYRRPVWRALSAATTLEVLLLASDEGLANERRRGEDWMGANLGSEPAYKHRFARSSRFERGESSYFLLRESARRLARGRDAVVFGGWESPAYWQILAAVGRSTRRVGFYESTLWSSRYSAGPIAAARARFYRSMDVVVVPGVAAGDAIRSMGVPAARILEGFNAVDVSSFAAASARVVSPTHAGHAFAYVGQLIERKNVAGMIRAFSKARGVHDTLTIVGSGDQLPMLKDLTLALGLEERVRFVGQVANEELPSVLVTVDTLILPSLEEVWGLVVNEALASGCQVIVSERAGVAPSVQGMRGVYIVSPTVDGIIKGIGLARSRYIGRVPKPEILRHSPEAFASVFQKAICD